jgi:hypothetical protein
VRSPRGLPVSSKLPLPKGRVEVGALRRVYSQFPLRSTCNGTAHALAVEAHGVGYSTLGALSLSLQKTIDVPGDMHGCLILTAPNEDTLNAIYDGTEGAPNANNFIVSATGTLTFTEGTGRFRNASGNAHFTADFSTIYPASSFLGGTTAPAQVMAFYSVEGTVLLHDGHDGDQ